MIEPVSPEARVSPGGLWLRRRARNAQHRSLLLAGVSGGSFVVLLLTLVLIPQRAHRAAQALLQDAAVRTDTSLLAARMSVATRQRQEAETALDEGRAANTRRVPITLPADTLSLAGRVRRDSLVGALAAIGQAEKRTESAPLLSSYRSLGDVAELRRDPRVLSTLDSLAAIDRAREALTALGGVDAEYVALTARAAELGRGLQALAEEKRSAIREELDRLLPARRVVPISAVDTLPLMAMADSAREQEEAARRDLAETRARMLELDRRAARAQQLLTIDASPLSMLAASLVLALTLGFAAALGGECWHPRVADSGEAELIAAARVLACFSRPRPNPDQQRRRTDREIPPVIDQMKGEYTALYRQLADATFSLSMLGVTGDGHAATAAVAANLATAAAQEGRSALLVDADMVLHSATAQLGVHSGPGVGELLEHRFEWAEALVPVIVGRDRSIDVLPAGHIADARLTRDELAVLRSGLEHLERRYDCVIVNAPGALTPLAGLPRQLIVCVCQGATPVAELQRILRALRDQGARVRGVVLWEGEEPMLPVVESVATGVGGGGGRGGRTERGAGAMSSSSTES